MNKLIKAKPLDNLEFLQVTSSMQHGPLLAPSRLLMLPLQWIKRYFDMHFGGHEYNALERRGGGSSSSSSKENSGAASAANPRSATAAAAAASAASTASKNRGTPVRAAARDVSNITGSAPSRPGSSMGKRPGVCFRELVSHLTRRLTLLRINCLAPISELRPAHLLKFPNLLTITMAIVCRYCCRLLMTATAGMGFAGEEQMQQLQEELTSLKLTVAEVCAAAHTCTQFTTPE